jgi:hypothetical protein
MQSPLKHFAFNLVIEADCMCNRAARSDVAAIPPVAATSGSEGAAALRHHCND